MLKKYITGVMKTSYLLELEMGVPSSIFRLRKKAQRTSTSERRSV